MAFERNIAARDDPSWAASLPTLKEIATAPLPRDPKWMGGMMSVKEEATAKLRHERFAVRAVRGCCSSQNVVRAVLRRCGRHNTTARVARRSVIDRVRRDNKALQAELVNEARQARMTSNKRSKANLNHVMDLSDAYARKIEIEKRQIYVRAHARGGPDVSGDTRVRHRAVVRARDIEARSRRLRKPAQSRRLQLARRERECSCTTGRGRGARLRAGRVTQSVSAPASGEGPRDPGAGEPHRTRADEVQPGHYKQLAGACSHRPPPDGAR